MIKEFNNIRVGDKFVVPAYGSDPFMWCFIDAPCLWDHTKAPLIKVEVSEGFGVYVRNGCWNNHHHGNLVHCQDEFGTQQWVPYNVLGVAVSVEDSGQFTFDSLWS